MIFRILISVSITILSCQAFAYKSSEALCSFDSEDFASRKRSNVVPFFLELKTVENESSSKNLVPIDGKDFVAKIYGTGAKDAYTLSLEVRLADGSFTPRGAASFYTDTRYYMLALVEGTNVLVIRCVVVR